MMPTGTMDRVMTGRIRYRKSSQRNAENASDPFAPMPEAGSSEYSTANTITMTSPSQ